MKKKEGGRGGMDEWREETEGVGWGERDKMREEGRSKHLVNSKSKVDRLLRSES